MNKYKKAYIATLASMGYLSVFGFSNIDLHNQPVSLIDNFTINTGTVLKSTTLNKKASNENELKLLNKSSLNNKIYTRYQQQYKGIEIAGKEVTIESQSGAQLTDSSTVSGKLVEDLELDTTPQISADTAYQTAMTKFQKAFPTHQVNPNNPVVKKLQIIQKQGANTLVYYIKFTAEALDKPPVKVVARINAKNGELVSIYNNLQSHNDKGPGGNEKVGKYWYGEHNIPYLDVTQLSDDICETSSVRIKAINLENTQKDKTDASQYRCGNNQGDPINGSFSVLNDAYYFGGLIIDMYQEWYKTPALQDKYGSEMQLVMRVHYGQNYENAFWNGENMTFGDGDPEGKFYPLVSLDVAGHEVSHGFTEQHSNLEYQNESGSLNEAFSDMAGQTVRAFLLSRDENNYTTFYPNDDQGGIGWGLGETITRGEGESLRYMDNPSKDGKSADCFDRKLAESSGENCKITYAEVVKAAEDKIPEFEWERRQGYIVHSGSGVFNKAFYLLSQKWINDYADSGDSDSHTTGIKQAFELFVFANNKYWNAQTGFVEAACGVKKSSQDLGYPTDDITKVFNQVGVSTSDCMV